MFALKDIKYYYFKLVRKIRNFLLSEKSREFLVFLFFFLISTGFWLLQTLKNDYEVEFAIPLQLKNIPDDIVLTAELPSELKITLKDKGTILLNYMPTQSFYPISIDFNEYKNKGSHVKILTRDLEKKIISQLDASTKLVNIKADVVDFIYSKGSAKKLAVKLQGDVSAGRQYYIPDTICSPDSVVVYAPKNILDKMHFVYSQRLHLIGITDTATIKVPFIPIKGVKYVPSSLTVTFPVDLFTEKTLEVPLIGTNFPKNKILRTFPSKVKVTFQVGLNRFKYIHPQNFILDISYDKLINSTTEKYKVIFKSLPKGISHVRISPEQVDFLIEQVSNGN